MAAHGIDEGGGARDVAAHDAEGLGERALDHRDAVRLAVALGDAAAARAVEADGMHLVEIGERTVALGHRAELGDGGDVAVHRIDALEGDELGGRGIGRRQETLEVRGIVVLEDALLAARRGGCLRSWRRG